MSSKEIHMCSLVLRSVKSINASEFILHSSGVQNERECASLVRLSIYFPSLYVWLRHVNAGMIVQTWMLVSSRLHHLPLYFPCTRFCSHFSPSSVTHSGQSLLVLLFIQTNSRRLALIGEHLMEFMGFCSSICEMSRADKDADKR